MSVKNSRRKACSVRGGGGVSQSIIPFRFYEHVFRDTALQLLSLTTFCTRPKVSILMER